MKDFLFYWGTITDISVFMVGLYYRRFLTREMKILLVYFGIISIGAILMVFLAKHHIHNLWLVHIGTLIEYTGLAAVFSFWQRRPNIRRSILISIPIIDILGIATFFLFEGPERHNDFTQSLVNLLMIILAAYTLFESNRDTARFLFRRPQFWVSIASLVYFGATLMLMASYGIIMAFSVTLLKKLFILPMIMDIIANFLFMGSFLCLVPPLKSSTLPEPDRVMKE